LTYIFWRCTRTSEIKFLGQGFQKSQNEQDRQTLRQTDGQTDTTKRIITAAFVPFVGGKMLEILNLGVTPK